MEVFRFIETRDFTLNAINDSNDFNTFIKEKTTLLEVVFVKLVAVNEMD